MHSRAYFVKRISYLAKKIFSFLPSRDTNDEIRDTYSASHFTRYAVFLVAWLTMQPVFAGFKEGPSKQGWHWYPPQKAEQSENEAVEPDSTQEDPTARIAAIQQELERLKAQAVLVPTEKNLLAYLHFQREQVDKASTFSDQFRRVVWAHPELDYTLERPTASLAKNTWLEGRNQEQINAVKALGKEYGLFFFFRSDCPYCHRFAPILKTFSQRYGLTVIPISLDGGALPEYPAPQLNQGQFERLMGRKAIVPAVVAVNPAKQKVVPISYGLVAQEELLNRIYVLTRVEVGRDY